MGLVRCGFLVLACIASATASAVVLEVESGLLAGARGVNVQGTIYDVRFVEGTCASVFSGCDSNSDFAFTTSESAGAAAQALLDTVFVNTSEGNFDTRPSLTFGCGADPCIAQIPWVLIDDETFHYEAARNSSLEALDSGGSSGGLLGFKVLDTNFEPFLVFARFTPSAIPEPGTLALLGISLASLAFSRRKRIANHGFR